MDIIVAVDADWGIGKDGDLLAAHFRRYEIFS